MVDYDRVDRINELIDKIADEEERLRIFLDSSPWGVLVVDKTFHIVFINKTLERMSGYKASEVIGKHMHMLMPKPDRKIHVDHEKKYVLNPHHRLGNHGLQPKLLTKAGAVLPVEISLSPTEVHGRTMFYASIRPLESLFNTVEGHERGV